MNVAASPQIFARLKVAPLTPSIGAEISGIDLSQEQDDAVVAEIRAALLAHKVVFFRDQPITPAQHIAFARRFGTLEIHPATPKDQPDPEVLHIAHGPDSKGKENAWHSDVTWRAEPSLGSILRAVEVPAVGGDTLFADMAAAFRGLSPAMQDFCRGLTAVHDIARVFAGRLGKPVEELHKQYPPQVHPLVRTIPRPASRRSMSTSPSPAMSKGCRRRRATGCSRISMRRRRSPNISVASAGSRVRSPSGTIAPRSIMPRRTISRRCGGWSG